MSEIWLVRHAETEWSVSRQHTGRTDIPLTERGRALARGLAAPLARHEFAAVYTSPLSRAYETARLAGFGDRARPRDELLEWDYGEYEGLTTEGIRRTRPGWYLWQDGCPGGETAEDVAARVDPLVAELATAEGDAVCFSHGHVLRALAARWAQLPPSAGGRLALSTGTISVLGFEREVRVVWRWNGEA